MLGGVCHLVAVGANKDDGRATAALLIRGVEENGLEPVPDEAQVLLTLLGVRSRERVEESGNGSGRAMEWDGRRTSASDFLRAHLEVGKGGGMREPGEGVSESGPCTSREANAC